MKKRKVYNVVVGELPSATLQLLNTGKKKAKMYRRTIKVKDITVNLLIKDN